ncbi:MAG TPA: methyltransferase domain-containing protein [Candidatus Paceibacterota bacterium]|nr:methyltransferase domain-containing protein [Candidatus Paceibacterota bacterium]
MVTTAGGFLDTERIAGELGIAEGMHVGDFGCGSGYFTVSAARRVGPEGRVYAVDVQTGPLEAVVAKGQQAGLENIVPVRADLEVLGGTNIPADALDVVLLANVLFQSQKKDAIVKEAQRTLKAGGRLLVIDWKKGAGGAVPDELRSDPEAMKKLVTGTGFSHERDVDAGPFYFGQVFRK